jgi:hypothetical protein
VTTPGPGTLILVGTLVDVVSKVPPDDAPGRYEVYLSDVGEATLILELRDSVTNEVLARVADRRAAESAGMAINANTSRFVRGGLASRATSCATDEVTTVGEMWQHGLIGAAAAGGASLAACAFGIPPPGSAA